MACLTIGLRGFPYGMKACSWLSSDRAASSSMPIRRRQVGNMSIALLRYGAFHRDRGGSGEVELRCTHVLGFSSERSKRKLQTAQASMFRRLPMLGSKFPRGEARVGDPAQGEEQD